MRRVWRRPRRQTLAARTSSCRASSPSRSMSARAIAIACAPTARRSGCTRPTALPRGRPRALSSRVQLCYCSRRIRNLLNPVVGGFMKTRMFILAAALAFAGATAAQTTLNVVTAGDQNMVDYVNNYLAPKFEAANPGVKVRAVGTGPGDAGSQKIYEKLSAQQKAGNNEWDIDVAVIHQLASATMVKEKLLLPYRNDVSVGKLVSRDTAKNALGADVDGYVMPMFHSQIAFAYNPELVKAPPKSFVELNDWVKKNPKQFGYNGVKGGMSGVGFVTGWVSAYSGLADQLEKGPYGTSSQAGIATAPGGL